MSESEIREMQLKNIELCNENKRLKAENELLNEINKSLTSHNSKLIHCLETYSRFTGGEDNA